MKLRTVLIGVAVTAALVGGIGYGAYYSMQSKKKPVEVVPVANVNTGYWGMSDSIYGSVTSQVAQLVTLNDEYSIEEIFVEAGDTVKEGTPLFSYDMTLPELELEMEELSLQAQEITLTKLEKDLEKLKNTNATASLELNTSQLTAASAEELLVEPLPDETGSQETNGNTAGENKQSEASGAVAGSDGEPEIQIDGIEAVDSAPNLDSDGIGSTASGAGESQAETESHETEKIEDSDTEGDDLESLSIKSSVGVYEQLVSALGDLFQDYADELRSDEISSAVKTAVNYYRKHLAEKLVKEEKDEDGRTRETVSYVIKEEVQEALGEEQTAVLETYSRKMDSYQARYVDMLIEEAQSLSGEKLRKAMETILEEYDLLTTKMQEKLEHADVVELYQEQLQEQTTEQQGKTDRETESTSDLLQETAAGEKVKELNANSSGKTESQNESSNAPDNTSESVNSSENSTENTSGSTGKAENETELQTGTQSETKPETEAAGADNGDVEGTSEESQSETGTDSEPSSESETGAETDITVIIADFRTKAETLLMEGAQPAAEDYLAAINLYQQLLANPQADMVSQEAAAKMEEYAPNSEVTAYLNTVSETAVQELSDTYRDVCFAYVKFMVTKMDAKALVREELTAAVEAYSNLGLTWQSTLEQRWQEEQLAAAGAGTQTETQSNELVQTTGGDTQSSSDSTQQSSASVSGTYPSLLDYLTAYDMILKIQELDLDQKKKDLKADLKELKEAYLALSETQQNIVWNSDELISLLKKYGMWNLETEPQTEYIDWGGDYFDDYYDDGDYYTAEELAEMIKDKEREIKDCELEIRESEIAVRKQQRIVDGKIVKSTMDGTVISIGSEDGSSDTDYFLKVANEAGLYAKGAMSELALEKIKVGDTISGMMIDSGISFTAVIKEISEYPESGSSMSYGYGSENTNASYYPFYALIEDEEGIEEGEAEIQLSENMTNSYDSIYLELFFVRTDSNGKSYVYKQGENGLLTKQIVETGKTYSNYAVEIVSGLSAKDRIAFPYGDDVFEGAKTKEVDMLEEAYM